MGLCKACGYQAAVLERPHGSTRLARRTALPAAAPHLQAAIPVRLMAAGCVSLKAWGTAKPAALRTPS